MHNELIYINVYKYADQTKFDVIISKLMQQDQNPFDNKEPLSNEKQSGSKRSDGIVFTAIKKTENPFSNQMTVRPTKKILLFGQNRARYLFPLVQDKQIGIDPKYQNIVVQSNNDDDRKTTSTQLHRGMIQTLEDLYEVVAKEDSLEYYTQQ